MVFAKRLRAGIRSGRIRCTVRIWTRCHVTVGGRYALDDGHVVVDSITAIELADITDDLALESGFNGASDLLQTAKHGSGHNVYLIRFHYLRAGAWPIDPADRRGETEPAAAPHRSDSEGSRSTSALLQRIRRSAPPPTAAARKARRTSRAAGGRKR